MRAAQQAMQAENIAANNKAMKTMLQRVDAEAKLTGVPKANAKAQAPPPAAQVLPAQQAGAPPAQAVPKPVPPPAAQPTSVRVTPFNPNPGPPPPVPPRLDPNYVPGQPASSTGKTSNVGPMATNPMFQPPTKIDWSGSAATATEFYDVSTPQEIQRPKRRAGAAEQAPGPMEDSTTLQSEK